MTKYLDVQTLTTPVLVEEDVSLERGVVRVRCLTRAEAQMASKAHDREGLRGMETVLLHRGMVEPKMSREQVVTWMASDKAGEVARVIKTISRISGMDDGADTERYKSDGERSGD